MKKDQPEHSFFINKEMLKIMLILKASVLIFFIAIARLSASGNLDGQNLTLMSEDQVLLEVLKNIESEDEVLDVLQQITLKGRVVDALTGEALPGVNIYIQGTTQGTVTNIEGVYSINVRPEDVLVFSFVGYHDKLIPVDGRSEINVYLDQRFLELDEVVAVGYGTQRRVNITGSVATVNYDEEMAGRPITHASQALSGKVTGLWVSQNSGKPGSDQAQLRIRGHGTMSSVDPLIIIDGIESSLSHINPNDIESISVLKDAASAAIYGSKAANGVILITTKQGRYEERMQISLNSYAGVQSLGRRFDIITNSADMMELYNEGVVNMGGTPYFPESLISAFRTGTDKYTYPNTDWYEYLYRNSLIHEHNFAIRGGSEQTSAYLSFNYLKQDGIMVQTNTQRYGLRANLESKIKDWITIGGRLNYIKQDSKEPYFPTVAYGRLGKVYTIFHTSAPFISPYTSGGRFGGVQALDGNGNPMFENCNPLLDAYNGQTIDDQNTFNVNAYAVINFTDNLSLRTDLASRGAMTVTDRFNETLYGYTTTDVPAMSRNYNREGIEIIRNYHERVDNQFYTTLNYSEIFDQKHRVSFVGGIQLEDLEIKTLYARRGDPPKEGLTQIDAGTIGLVNQGNKNSLRMFSYFGRINYSFSDKYLFEANFRADASSRFKEGNRWGYFPGFSVGWRLIEEEFIQNLNVFSDLKIRGSWGKLGNQNIAGYWPYLSVINQTFPLSYSYGGVFYPGGAVTSIVEENITWETTTSFDFGFEAAFFNNRISIGADYFDKITEGILVQLPIPLMMGGVSAPHENVGEMTNKGFELNVAYNKSTRDRNQLGYSISANMTHVKNLVTKFRGGDSPDQLYLIREGYSYQTVYGYKVIGIYQTDEEAAQHMHASGYTPRAGDFKFEDVNNDGRLGHEDKQEIGNTIPRFTFGLNPSLTYKGFDLSAVISGIARVNTWNLSHLTYMTAESPNVTKRRLDSWRPDNTDTKHPRILVNDTWNTQQSSYWSPEISFVKLKNIQLGYLLPDIVSSRLGMNRVYIYLNAQNVGTLVSSEYEGYDPERSTTHAGANMYPAPRIISFGLSVEL